MSQLSLEGWLESRPENARILAQEDFILEVAEQICELMEEKDISRTEIAERVGKSRSAITQILSGDRNMTLRTISDFAYALNCLPRIEFVRDRQRARVGDYEALSCAYEISGRANKASYGGDETVIPFRRAA